MIFAFKFEEDFGLEVLLEVYLLKVDICLQPLSDLFLCRRPSCPVPSEVISGCILRNLVDLLLMVNISWLCLGELHQTRACSTQGLLPLLLPTLSSWALLMALLLVGATSRTILRESVGFEFFSLARRWWLHGSS